MKSHCFVKREKMNRQLSIFPLPWIIDFNRLLVFGKLRAPLRMMNYQVFLASTINFKLKEILYQNKYALVMHNKFRRSFETFLFYSVSSRVDENVTSFECSRMWKPLRHLIADDVFFSWGLTTFNFTKELHIETTKNEDNTCMSQRTKGKLLFFNSYIHLVNWYSGSQKHPTTFTKK